MIVYILFIDLMTRQVFTQIHVKRVYYHAESRVSP